MQDVQGRVGERKEGGARVLVVRTSLVCILLLGVAMYWPTLQKPFPPGVDASVYLNEARWSIVHDTIPKPSQPLDRGTRAYTAPLSSVNLVLLQQLTGGDLVARLFTFYELGLILLLALSCYLVGRTYNPTIALLFPMFVLGNFAVSRLFIGSTISNLLTFTYVNLVYYAATSFVATRRARPLLLLLLGLVATYFTHNFLTAPILLPVVVVYGMLLLGLRADIRHMLAKAISRIPLKFKISFAVFALVLVSTLLVSYVPAIKEAKFAFWRTTTTDRFLGPVSFDQFGEALGPALILIGAVGALLYVSRVRENLLSHRVFPVLWIGVVLGLLQLTHLGVNFYFERIVFLGAVFFSLFAAYLIGHPAFRGHVHPRIARGLVALSLTLIVIQGAVRVQSLYASSNRVSANHLTALLWLKDQTHPDAVVYSNVSAVSQTAHDFIVSDRTILHFTTVKDRCSKDPACEAFASPDDPASLAYFRSHSIGTFMFLRPGEEGNELLDRLLRQYDQAGFERALSNDEAIVYQLP